MSLMPDLNPLDRTNACTVFSPDMAKTCMVCLCLSVAGAYSKWSIVRQYVTTVTIRVCSFLKV